MEKILLDTDAGSDIDDAVALAYLLRQPRCDLLGVTTVTGEVEKRAAIVEAVCAAAGREVPIHLGRREPLLDGPGQPHVPHYDAIRDLSHRLDREENAAVAFLRDTIRAHPGEVTLLTIGPYSNVALLFALDPGIPSLLKGVVSMGGVFLGGDRREWNALVDPTATAITYRTARPRHITVGLDVTERCTMTREEVQARFVGEPLATVRRMADRWFEGAERMTFHDPLAAALIFEPGLAGYTAGRVECDSVGHTKLIEGEGSDLVAASVDAEAFFAHFFKVCSSSDKG